MDIAGEHRIAAPRDQVWAALNDADVLRQCIPGCESLTKESETEFSAVVLQKIGPVKARFNGAVALTNIRAPESYTIGGEGNGGVAGFAKGAADVHLAEDGEVTILTYAARATIGGKLAQIGSRLIDSSTRRIATQFFERFENYLNGRAVSDAS